MYSLDINFLKDREIRVYEAKPRRRGGGQRRLRRIASLWCLGYLRRWSPSPW